MPLVPFMLSAERVAQKERYATLRARTFESAVSNAPHKSTRYEKFLPFRGDPPPAVQSPVLDLVSKRAPLEPSEPTMPDIPKASRNKKDRGLHSNRSSIRVYDPPKRGLRLWYHELYTRSSVHNTYI